MFVRFLGIDQPDEDVTSGVVSIPVILARQSSAGVSIPPSTSTAVRAQVQGFGVLRRALTSG